MASTRLKSTSDGRGYYEIRVRPERGKEYVTRWYIPAGWSQKAIDRELIKFSADFERKCKAGEVKSRKEKRIEAEQEAKEAANILTLRQYANMVFMPAKAVTMSENSRSSYQGHIDRDILPTLGEMKLPDISSRQITALLSKYQSGGKSVASCVKLYTVLQGIFKMAFLDDTISVNPMLKVQRPKPRKDETISTEPECFTVEELQKILLCLSNEPLRWQCFIRLLIDTGCRRGEACGLQWRDIDFKTGRINICRELSYTPQAGVYIDTTKNRKARSFSIAPDILEQLRQLRREQGNKAISEWVFSQDGSSEPMHPTSPTHYFRQFGKRYGIDGFHPHKLRHSFASISLTSGADVVSVSEKLGHSDTSVTLRVYAHASADSIEAASNVFRNAINSELMAQ